MMIERSAPKNPKDDDDDERDRGERERDREGKRDRDRDRETGKEKREETDGASLVKKKMKMTEKTEMSWVMARRHTWSTRLD
jgi:hypothetical protein